ncbi:hypothetical protein V6U90_12395 [Micromonospora sp. CPCC 206060]|uniref:hypothetical protein n=1 Tax=Micromonospora sp. CPCC 206060 TaxID=3122406 RepID=UPI002FF3904D
MSHDDRPDHPSSPERAQPAPGTDSPATTGGALDVPAQRRPVPVAPPDGPAVRQPYEVVTRPIGWAPPHPPGRFASWWARPSTVLFLLLILLALLTSTTVLAVVAITDGPGVNVTASPAASGSSTPTPSAGATPGLPSTPAVPPTPTAPVTPTGGPSGPVSPDAAVNLPIPPPDAIGVRFQGGTLEETRPGPNSGYDFDTGREDFVGSSGSSRADLVVTRYGLVGLNGVGFAPFAGGGRPQLGACAAIPRPDWVLDVPAAQLKAGRTFCLTTTAGRFGYLTVQESVFNNAGQLNQTTFIYLVWEGPND